MKKHLEIRRLDNDEAIKRIDLTGRSVREIERIQSRVSINIDHKRCYTVITESNADPAKP